MNTWSGDFLKAVFGCEMPVLENFDEAFEYVLSTLNSDESKVIKARFADGKTLKEIGVEFGLSEEIIRQSESIALRKIRYPSRCIYFKQAQKIPK